MNFDASFVNECTSMGVVLRNNVGVILRAWTNHFQNELSFCAETEAALQVLKLAQSMNLDRVTIQGDALNVIMTFSGMSKVED